MSDEKGTDLFSSPREGLLKLGKIIEVTTKIVMTGKDCLKVVAALNDMVWIVRYDDTCSTWYGPPPILIRGKLANPHPPDNKRL